MVSDTRAIEPRSDARAPQAIGRYWIYDEIAAGGMATVHLGRLVGPAGFTRTVAIKRLHPQFAKDDEFSSMFLDEARIAARIRHPNALTALDVVAVNGELYIVMDYIHGESLGKLLRGGPLPLGVASAIMTQALLGLHAAHEAVDDRGIPLSIVHRDVSPQNVLVGVDGVARVVDFGIAKAASRVHTTQAGKIKGKLSYMSPQQVQSEDVDRRADIFAAGVVLWESIVGRKLLARGEATITRVSHWQGLPNEDALLVPAFVRPIIARALARDPNERFSSAREMAMALGEVIPPASSMEVGDWVEQRAHQILADRARAVSDVERQTSNSDVHPAFVAEIPQLPSGSDARRTALTANGTEARSIPPTRRNRLVLLAGAIALLGLFGVWLNTSRRGPAAVERAALVPSSHRVVSPAPSITALLPPVVVPPPVASAAVPPAPSAAAATLVSAKGSTPSAAKRSSASAKTTPAVDCDPPFEIGKDGIKHFKPECFK